MKIYTKTGDDGTTSLFDGTRVSKDNARVDTYGEVDELNATIGVCIAVLNDSELKGHLLDIQRDLFALGAQLANPKNKKQKSKADFNEDKIKKLENLIDKGEAELEPITNFILHGGSLPAATLDLARTICRRAERKLITLSKHESFEPNLLIYLNRLSDLLFMLARVANKRLKVCDIIW